MRLLLAFTNKTHAIRPLSCPVRAAIAHAYSFVLPQILTAMLVWART